MTKDIKIKHKLILIALFFWLQPYALYAEQDPTTQQPTNNENSMLFQKLPSVFDASKYEDRIKGVSKYNQQVAEAPSSVSIVLADEIKKYGYRTLADILQGVRGFYISPDRNYSFLGVRGFSRPGDYNTRVLLLVDGHRLNDNVFDQAYIGTEFPLDVDLIDRVEVMRGPGSSLYGTNAFFAIVNVITKRGRDLGGAELAVAAASHDTYKTRGSYGTRYKNGMELLLSGSYLDSDGDDLYFKEFDDPATNNGIAEDLDYNRDKSFFGELIFHDFTLQGVYSDWKKGVPTASFGTVFNDSRFFTKDEHTYLSLKYERDYSHDLGVMARISYNRHEYYGEYPLDYADPGDPPYLVANIDTTEGEWWGAEFNLKKELFDSHNVILGAEYRNNTKQDQQNFDVDGVYLDDSRDSTVWALFLQDEFKIYEQLIFNGGVRYDHYDTFGSTVNPRLALIYTPFESSALKLLYGEAFRAPNSYELYYGDGGNSLKPNPNIEPEEIKTYELIYEQFITDQLRATAMVFFNDMENLISSQTDPADGLIFYDNVEEVESKGFELELENKWQNGMEGRISYAFQETENEVSWDILTNSPKHLAKFNVLFPLLKERLFLGVEEQYSSKKKTVSGNYTDDFFVTNVTLFSHNLISNLDLSASIYNLFDESYGAPGSEEHEQDTIEQDGITFRFKLNFTF